MINLNYVSFVLGLLILLGSIFSYSSYKSSLKKGNIDFFGDNLKHSSHDNNYMNNNNKRDLDRYKLKDILGDGKIKSRVLSSSDIKSKILPISDKKVKSRALPSSNVESLIDNLSINNLKTIQKSGGLLNAKLVKFYYFDSDHVKGSIEIKNGVADGTYKEYYYSGNLKATGRYSNGSIDGLISIYDEKGKVISKIENNYKALKGTVNIYKNDNKIYSIYYVNGKVFNSNFSTKNERSQLKKNVVLPVQKRVVPLAIKKEKKDLSSADSNAGLPLQEKTNSLVIKEQKNGISGGTLIDSITRQPTFVPKRK